MPNILGRFPALIRSTYVMDQGTPYSDLHSPCWSTARSSGSLYLLEMAILSLAQSSIFTEESSRE